uniref:Uncharacterized protein n=1 Tax=Avena sativa TaxID=4498 RepID=A0ACD5Y0L3_AVESA
MGRPRGGKANKSMDAAKNEDAGSGAEEVIPAYKRRGRPQKLRKDAVEDEEEEDMGKVDEDGDGAKKTNLPSKDSKGAAAENGGKKRRRQSKRGSDSVAEDKSGEPARPLNGFRQNGSRRKSTPRRAAEAGLQTK